jgi:hypothetical protein
LDGRRGDGKPTGLVGQFGDTPRRLAKIGPDSLLAGDLDGNKATRNVAKKVERQ